MSSSTRLSRSGICAHTRSALTPQLHLHRACAQIGGHELRIAKRNLERKDGDWVDPMFFAQDYTVLSPQRRARFLRLPSRVCADCAQFTSAPLAAHACQPEPGSSRHGFPGLGGRAGIKEDAGGP